MKSWIEQLKPIIEEYKDGTDDPLDGDDVDRLCEIIKAKINFCEGNITEQEYNDLLDGKPPTFPVEIGFLKDDYTWHTEIMDIPEGEDPIVYTEAWLNNEHIERVHVFIYNAMLDER